MFAFIRTKHLSLFAGLALLATSITGCKDNDDSYSTPSIEIAEALKTSGLNLGVDGTEQAITFTANRKWTASVPTWLDVTPASGEAGTYTLKVKALANNGIERTGQILIKYGSASQSINVTQAGSGNASATFEGVSLADFIAKYGTSGDVTVADDVSFQAVVISDKDGGNLSSLKNIYVQGEGAGIAVRLASNNTYPVGTLLTFKAQGALVSRYNGSLQINLEKGGSVADAGEVRTVTPTVATLEEIYAGKYENMLVAVDGIQFKDATGNLYSGTYTTVYSELTDCATQPTTTKALSLAVTKYAVFKDTAKSDKKGRIIGILTHSTSTSGSHVNLYPRTLADIQLTDTRCTESNTTTPPVTPPNNGGGNTGGSTPTNPTTTDHPIITMYVEPAKGNDKYIQLYNPTQTAIDLSAYSIKMENFNGSQSRSGEMELKLPQMTLAPGAIVIIHNSAAKIKGLNTASLIAAGTTSTTTVCNFNGNDNVALFYGETMIDVLGVWSQAWRTTDNKDGGANVILRRKATITKGNTSFLATEWDSEPVTAEFTDVTFLNARP